MPKSIQPKIKRFASLYLLQFAKFACSLAGTMTLARLITPAEFGMFAIASTYISVCYPFRDGGLSNITLQDDTLTDDRYTLMLLGSIGFGLFLATAFFLAVKPIVINLYDSREITSALQILALGFVFYGGYAQLMARMRRERQFIKVEVVSTIAQYLALGLAIALAFLGQGVYALACQLLGLEILTLLGMLLICPRWKLTMNLSRSSLKIFKNSFNSLQSITVISVSGYLDQFLLSLFTTNTIMGFYSKSKQVLTIPQRLLIMPIRNVVIPYMAQSTNETNRLEIYKLYQLAVLTGPSAMLIICTAFPREAISILLGPNWLPAIEIFQVLALIMAIELLARTIEPFLVSVGQYGLMARWSYINASLNIAAISIGAIWGIWGILSATLLAVFVKSVVAVYTVKRAVTGHRKILSSMASSLALFFFLTVGYAHGTKALFSQISNNVLTVFPATLCIYLILAVSIWFSPYRSLIRTILNSNRTPRDEP